MTVLESLETAAVEAHEQPRPAGGDGPWWCPFFFFWGCCCWELRWVLSCSVRGRGAGRWALDVPVNAGCAAGCPQTGPPPSPWC